MPNFIIDCSRDVLNSHSEVYIIQEIHDVALATGLFNEKDIKVRLHLFETYLVANKRDSFIHVFAHIMAGRSIEQRARLSKMMVQKLASLFPDFSHIAMNIREIEKATYFNKDML